jgi:hypothetical protein
MVTELVVAAASAVLAPQLLGGVVSKIPGGPVGLIAAGAAGIYFGRKMTGVGKAALVGASAGLLVMAAASFVLKSPSVTA